MKAFAIDPGPEQSAFCIWDGNKILDKGITENIKMLKQVDEYHEHGGIDMVIETIISSRGMPVGKETFQTVFWVGRFYERWQGIISRHLITRQDVKLHLCGNPKAKDSNIIAAIVDIFDPMRKFGKYGKGTKKCPGPLFGMSQDIWQALALAVVWFERGNCA